MSCSTDSELNSIYAISNYVCGRFADFYKIYKITNKVVFLRLLRDEDIFLEAPDGYSLHKKIAIDEYHMDCMGRYRDKRIKKEDLHKYKKINEYEYKIYD
jgi:hypothetical protein